MRRLSIPHPNWAAIAPLNPALWTGSIISILILNCLVCKVGERKGGQGNGRISEVVFTAQHIAVNQTYISKVCLLKGLKNTLERSPHPTIITVKKVVIMDARGEVTSGLGSMSHGPTVWLRVCLEGREEYRGKSNSANSG